MVSFYRYLLGYVRIKIIDESPEVFVNLLIDSNISLWSIERTKEYIAVNISFQDYKSIRKIRNSLRTKPKIKLIKKNGFSLKVKEIFIRKSIIYGLILALSLNITMSNYIWVIQVNGAKTISEKVIISVLSEEGICLGIKRENVDTYNLSQKLPLKIKNIAWVSVNIEGSMLSVNISETRDENPEIKTPSNIIASFDGVIKEINTTQGKTEVRIGQTVRKGELLISGIDEMGGVIRYGSANGEIIAETNRVLKDKIPKNYTILKYSNETDCKIVFHLFSLQLPMYLSNTFEEYDSFLVENNLILFNKTMPVKITKKFFIKTEKQKTEMNYKQAKNIAMSNFEKKIRNLKISEITTQNLSFTEDNKYFYFTLEIICKENICSTQNINVSNY